MKVVATETESMTASTATAVILAVVGGVATSAGGISEDAVSALVNLGYRRAEAFGAVARVTSQLGSDTPVERLITAGLKELAS